MKTTFSFSTKGQNFWKSELSLFSLLCLPKCSTSIEILSTPNFQFQATSNAHPTPTLGCVLIIYCCIINYLQTWWLINNKHLLRHSVCGSGTQAQRSWVVLAQGLSSSGSQDTSWGCSHLKAWSKLSSPLSWLVSIAPYLISLNTLCSQM